MTLPAKIRINASVPFPALVQGANAVGITKSNGIWTVGLAYTAIATQTPPVSRLTTDYIAVYDSVAQTYFTTPLSAIAVSSARPQRLVTGGPVVFASTDQVLNLKLTAAFTSTLPSYLGRMGLPLTLCDVTKLYGLTFYAQQFNAAAGETIDGVASVSITLPGQSITLMPMNDGASVGWKQT